MIKVFYRAIMPCRFLDDPFALKKCHFLHIKNLTSDKNQYIEILIDGGMSGNIYLFLLLFTKIAISFERKYR